MLPLLKFYFQEEVRQAAVQCIPDLLRSAYLAAQKGMPGADANYVVRMVDFIWGPLVEAIGKVLSLPLLGPTEFLSYVYNSFAKEGGFHHKKAWQAYLNNCGRAAAL